MTCGRCRVLVLGAGETGETHGAPSPVARRAGRGPAAWRTVRPNARRRWRRRLGGRAVPDFAAWTRRGAATWTSSITSTAAPGFVVTQAQLAAVMRGRRDRPLFVIDIAVPRDVEPVGQRRGGRVSLRHRLARRKSPGWRWTRASQEMGACERIIRGHVERVRRLGGLRQGTARTAGGRRMAAVGDGLGGDARSVFDAVMTRERRTADSGNAPQRAGAGADRPDARRPARSVAGGAFRGRGKSRPPVTSARI